jgi:hypothetical protein
VVQQQRSKSSQGKIKSLAGAVFTAITKGHLVEEYRRLLLQRQKTTTRKPGSGSASPQVIRYRVQEAREAFEIMVRKKTAKGTTFEENLELVYLSQGFRKEQDAQGEEWLVKDL